jgi:hypothetical protein
VIRFPKSRRRRTLKRHSNNSEVRRLKTRARRNVGKLDRGEKTDAIKWRDVNALLLAGGIESVPAGTDLEEFLWQTIPGSRPEIEARNPGRSFVPAEWTKKG